MTGTDLEMSLFPLDTDVLDMKAAYVKCESCRVTETLYKRCIRDRLKLRRNKPNNEMQTNIIS